MEGDMPSVHRASAEGNPRVPIVPNRSVDLLSSADESENDDEMLVRTTRVPKYLCGKYTIHHIIVFMITFWSFALIHAMRKTFSNVKSTILATWTPQNLTDYTFKADYAIWNDHRVFHTTAQAESFLGVMDSVFMFCYAAGLFISGILGDRFDPRLVLSLGMFGTAFVNFIFGFVLEVAHFYSVVFFVIIWILNGFLQSTAWPAEVCVMGDWFGRSSRGFVLGIWSGCASIGNVVGAYLAAAVLPYGYEYPFLVASNVLFAGGIVVFFGLVSRPRQIGLPEPDEGQNHDSTKTLLPSTIPSSESSNEPINFWRAFTLPGVMAYSAAYGSLKLVNYSFFFWLPYYLKRNFGWSEEVSGTVASWYDWGGIIGVTLAGALSDRLGKRTPVIIGQLFFGFISLGVIIACPSNENIAGTLMGIAGFFVGGAANLVSGAVSADLGRQEALKQDARALSTVTGIVDGTGSVGAALGQVMIPVLQLWFGWNAVFYMFMVMTVVTALCLAKLCWKEIRELRSMWFRRYNRFSDVDSGD